MTTTGRVLDALLAVALPTVALRALTAPQPSTAVALFIALGLLSAVSWARLAAPDLALVEAALGAGFTGALFGGALGWRGKPLPRVAPWMPHPLQLPPLVLVAVVLGGAVLALPESAGLAQVVSSELPREALTHPVSAVLLDFRGYDTLLETAVLVAASVGARRALPHEAAARVDHRLTSMARLLVPASFLVALYLLWRGAAGPGGAFQASAVLAGASVLLSASGQRSPADVAFPRSHRRWMVAGPAVFTIFAALPVLGGASLLHYPAGSLGWQVLVIELGLLVSVATLLGGFFSLVASEETP